MKKLCSILIVFSFIVSGCGSSDEDSSKTETIRIGSIAVPHAEILESIKEDLKKEGYSLDIVIFNDYILPNTALADGELDANYFQHIPYLEQFNKEKNTDFVSVAAIHFEPLGIYSKDTTKRDNDFSVDDVKENAKISVPNDPTNEARALQLLADRDIITLKADVGLKATKADIIENPKNIQLVEVDPEGVAATLPEVDFAIVNGNYALSNGIEKHLIVNEDSKSIAADTFANVVAVNRGDEKDPKIKALIKVLTSKKTKKFIEKTYNNDSVIVVF